MATVVHSIQVGWLIRTFNQGWDTLTLTLDSWVLTNRLLFGWRMTVPTKLNQPAKTRL